MERLISLLGIFTLLGIGYACSSDRRRIPWRVVVLGILLQAWFALFLVRPEWVRLAATLTSAACLLALLLPRALGEFAGLVARGLGVAGAAIVLWEACRHLDRPWFLAAVLALALGVVRLPARPRALALLAASFAGLLAVPVLLWAGRLPPDFVYRALTGMAAGISRVAGFATEGAAFVFGGIVRESPFVFAIDVTAILLVFSSLMSVLYYVGILPRIVGFLGRVLHKGLGVSGAESLATAANVFVGQTEAPLLIRPYLARMTRSEVMALMTGGFATIAGTVFAVYVGFLEGAGLKRGGADLICASVMSAPAAFVFAKLFVPETGVAETREGGAAVSRDRIGTSLLDALANGVTQGIRLAVNIGAMILVFVALIAMLNALVVFVAREVSPGSDLSFQQLYAWVFWPFAWLMGVPAEDCLRVGELLGTKTIFNEFLAYRRLGGMIQEGGISTRAAVLSTYALCGFANFGSIGVQLGGLSALAPERRPDFARLALRAMIAAALACQLTACIVGLIGDF
ncbi:MAG TPA: nucleoside transporter C-terminal domain-containing protein [Planctomycetota bacterium]|nr:nucleoside transporter C-terminal domain-containing protein [Planctomycetota bacterium]